MEAALRRVGAQKRYRVYNRKAAKALRQRGDVKVKLITVPTEPCRGSDMAVQGHHTSSISRLATGRIRAGQSRPLHSRRGSVPKDTVAG